MKTLLIAAIAIVAATGSAPAQEAVQGSLGGRTLFLSPIGKGKLPMIVAQQAVTYPNGNSGYQSPNSNGSWQVFTAESSRMPGWVTGWFTELYNAVGKMFGGDSKASPWGVPPHGVFGPKNP